MAGLGWTLPHLTINHTPQSIAQRHLCIELWTWGIPRLQTDIKPQITNFYEV